MIRYNTFLDERDEEINLFFQESLILLEQIKEFALEHSLTEDEMTELLDSLTIISESNSNPLMQFLIKKTPDIFDGAKKLLIKSKEYIIKKKNLIKKFGKNGFNKRLNSAKKWFKKNKNKKNKKVPLDFGEFTGLIQAK